MDNLAQSQTVVGSNLIISCFSRSQVIYIISLNCCNALLQYRNIFCLEVLSYTLFIIFFNILEEVSGSIGNLLQSFNAYTYNVYKLFKVCFVGSIVEPFFGYQAVFNEEGLSIRQNFSSGSSDRYWPFIQVSFLVS